jgi:hypothetical protein
LRKRVFDEKRRAQRTRSDLLRGHAAPNNTDPSLGRDALNPLGVPSPDFYHHVSFTGEITWTATITDADPDIDLESAVYT